MITYLVEIKNPELSDFLSDSFSDINPETIEKIKVFLSNAAVELDSLIDLINLKKGGFYSTDWKEKINIKDSITNLLPQKLSELRSLVGEHYNQFFQKIGNNIRLSRFANDVTIAIGNMFSLPARVTRIIEILREIDKISDVKTRIVIDAIRNPFELIYLRDRYSPLFAIAITTTDADRHARMTISNYTADRFKKLMRKSIQPSTTLYSAMTHLCRRIFKAACRNQTYLFQILVARPRQTLT